MGKKASGQALVEFALTIPLVLLLIMGLFDIGRGIFYYAVLNSAVREGTRLAVVQQNCQYQSNPQACSGGTPDTYPLNCLSASSQANVTICSHIQDMFFGIQELNTAAITITHTSLGANKSFINIRIEHLYQPILPGLVLISDIPIHVESQMMKVPLVLP